MQRLEEVEPQRSVEVEEDRSGDVDTVEERLDGWREGQDRLGVWVIHDGGLVKHWDRVEDDSAKTRFSRLGA